MSNRVMKKPYWKDYCKPVLVEWDDACQVIGWNTMSKTGPSDLRCVTIGHLIGKSKDRITLAMNTSDGADGMYMEIPLGMVKKIRRLKV